MRKKIAVFTMFAALSSWSLARSMNPAAQDNDKDKQHVAAPITSGPNVDADERSAVIRWHTDRMTTTAVKYGTDQNNLKDERLPGGSRDHKVTLADLQPGTHYVYHVLDANGNVQKTGDFTTKGSSSASNSGSQSGSSANASGNADNVRILDGPRPQNVTPNSATIYWRTDDVAASDVKYGLDQNNPDKRAYERGGSREHTAELTSLEPGKTYYYQILRRDGSVRTSGQFSTPTSSAATTPSTGTPAQPGTSSTVAVNKGPVPQYVNQNTAVISWSTDKQSSSTVKYGTDPNDLNQSATGNWGTNHQVQVQGLQPSTTYYYQVQSSQAEGTGNVASSQTANFQTVAPGQQAKQQSWHF
jgi:phosphodiesterase/alkaline phosphatase D-like protein